MTSKGPEIIDLIDSDDDDDDDDSMSCRKLIPTRILADGCVETLVDDDDDAEENRKPAALNSIRVKSSNGSSAERTSASKRQRTSSYSTKNQNSPAKAAVSTEDDDNEQDLQIIQSTSNLPHSFFVPNLTHKPSDDDDDGNHNEEEEEEELVLLGQTGQNALSEFPHARENCVNYIFTQSPHDQHCTHCFCMVCDIPASECQSWQGNHCHAIYSDPAWRRARDQAKRQKTQCPAVAVAGMNAAAGRHHSVTTPIPRSDTFHFSGKPALGIAQLLAAATRMYPREASPPNPPFASNLRHYQKQSLAFMQDMERSESSGWQAEHLQENFKIRGGWLASEVGMGKTAVVLALISSDPPIQMVKVNVRNRMMTKVKATVVMTSVSLMGQWEDECQKHAPALKVVRYHGKSVPTTHQIKTADIIISTATFEWDSSIAGKFLFRRHVWDESHLKSSSARADFLAKVDASFKWCVSATPVTSSLFELDAQFAFLRMPGILRHGMRTSVEVVQEHMIRHLKSQVIQGSSALTLPASTTSIVLIDPSDAEREKYKSAVTAMRHRLMLLRVHDVVAAFNVLNTLQYPLGKPFLTEDSSKINALRAALIRLKSEDSNMRAVVFSQMREMQKHVVSMVNRMHGIKIYCFDGSSAAKKRDDAIRTFQSMDEPGAAVFSITLRSGSVGITLTAATHVFLMEPCIHPVHEIQAAGRIHRLGQTKPVHVTKFVYSNTYEPNIVELHRRIEAGDIQFSEGGIPRAGIDVLLNGIVKTRRSF